MYYAIFMAKYLKSFFFFHLIPFFKTVSCKAVRSQTHYITKGELSFYVNLVFGLSAYVYKYIVLLYMCICVQVYVCKCAHPYGHIRRPEIFRYEVGSLINLELCVLATLASQWVPKFFLYLYLEFVWYLGFELRSSCVPRKNPDLSHVPSMN